MKADGGIQQNSAHSYIDCLILTQILERWHQLWCQWLLPSDRRLVEEHQRLLISWVLVFAFLLVLFHHPNNIRWQLALPYLDTAHRELLAGQSACQHQPAASLWDEWPAKVAPIIEWSLVLMYYKNQKKTARVYALPPQLWSRRWNPGPSLKLR